MPKTIEYNVLVLLTEKQAAMLFDKGELEYKGKIYLTPKREV